MSFVVHVKECTMSYETIIRNRDVTKLRVAKTEKISLLSIT